MVWSGVGLLGVIIPGAAGTGGYFLLLPIGLGSIGAGCGLVVGAVLTFWLAGLMESQDPGSAGTVYWIPLEYWSLLVGAVGLVDLVGNLVRFYW